MARTLIIGDIHGCWTELQELLAEAEIGGDDRIIAVGDLVDRGPESERCLDFFTGPGDRCRSVMGNHERKHVRSFRSEIPPAVSQTIVRAEIGEERYPEAIERMAALPLSIELPEALVVHGFFEPGVALSEQSPLVLAGTLTGEYKLDDRLDRPWYELYDGDKPIVVGHRNYRGDGEPLIWQNRVYGLDTSCCRGGRLTGLLLPEFRIVSVPSREDYWAVVFDDNHARRTSAERDEELGWDRANAILDDLRGRRDPTPDEIERGKRLYALVYSAYRAWDLIVAELVRLIRSIREDIADEFGEVSEDEEERLFAAILVENSFAPLVHLMRKNKLELRYPHPAFRTPRSLIDFATAAGILAEDAHE